MPCNNRPRRADGRTKTTSLAQGFVNFGHTFWLIEERSAIGTDTNAVLAGTARCRIHHRRGCLQLHFIFDDNGQRFRRRAVGLCHGVRNVLGALTDSGNKDTFGHCGKRGQFRMSLHEKTLLIRAQIKEPGNIPRVRPRYHGRGKDNHIHGQFDEFACDGILRLDNQTSRFINASGHTRTLAADEFHILFNNTVVKFFIAFAGGAHVNVKLIHICRSLFLEQMCKFERIHAANPAAVLIVVFISASNTVENGNGMRFLAVPERHLAACGSGGIEEPFHFQRVVNTGIFTVTVLNEFPGIHEIITGRHNDSPDLHSGEGILLFKVDGFLLADLFTQAAFAFLKECTGFPIDDRLLRHSLRKRNVDGFSLHQTFIPF